MHTYRALVVRVVDGDTVDLDVDLGFHLTARIRARLARVDTPERGEPGWAFAGDELRRLLGEAADDEGYVIVRTSKTGKYGRWIAEIEGVNEHLARRWPY